MYIPYYYPTDPYTQYTVNDVDLFCLNPPTNILRVYLPIALWSDFIL